MSLKDKFNKAPVELPKSKSKNTSNLEVVNQMIQKTVNTESNKTANTENNKTVNTVLQEKKRNVKKATFELEEDLHKQLKAQAAMEGRKMIELVEEALQAYLNK